MKFHNMTLEHCQYIGGLKVKKQHKNAERTFQLKTIKYSEQKFNLTSSRFGNSLKNKVSFIIHGGHINRIYTHTHPHKHSHQFTNTNTN